MSSDKSIEETVTQSENEKRKPDFLLQEKLECIKMVKKDSGLQGRKL